MTTGSVVTMVIILGAVWGGFITLLYRAAQSDRRGDGGGP